MSFLKSLAGSAVRALYPYGSVRKIYRGQLRGMRYRVGQAMGMSYAWALRTEQWRSLGDLITPGSCIYDIGANRGQSTLFLASSVGSHGRVIAFEPVPENHNDLQFNIAINQLHHVTAVCLAAADCEGENDFIFDARASTAGRIKDASVVCDSTKVIRVRLCKLEDYRANGWPFPQFLKIDAEGGAGKVLRGAKALLAEHRPHVFVELHNREEQEAVRSLLQEHDYEARTMDGHIVTDPTAGWWSPLLCLPRGN